MDNKMVFWIALQAFGEDFTENIMPVDVKVTAKCFGN
jgi:hypothetical protein